MLYVAVVAICSGVFSVGAFAAVPSPSPDTGAPTGSVAAADSCSNDKPVLLFPPWFRGLKCKNDVVQITDINQIWIIVMNVVQWLIIAGGYVALYFIIWSGFKYIIAAGDPQKITTAKETITNAVIGLVIVLVSTAIVQTIQASI
jgi:hypothetical protein